MEEAGFVCKGNGVMRPLDGSPPPHLALANSYVHRVLDKHDPATVP